MSSGRMEWMISAVLLSVSKNSFVRNCEHTICPVVIVQVQVIRFQINTSPLDKLLKSR
jgi:hypothetical protein